MSGAERKRMPVPRDREQLKPSFIAIFMEHPVITLIAAMAVAVVVFSHLMT
jgi:hypothetical protein